MSVPVDPDGEPVSAGPVLAGCLLLPDGARVRGRSLRRPLPAGPEPTFGVYLGGRREARPVPPWAHRLIDWPDLRTPRDTRLALAVLADAHARALAGGRVEVGCRGGRGRTGTALAALAVLAGVHPDAAVAWVREHHDPRAVETPWQRRWVTRVPGWRPC